MSYGALNLGEGKYFSLANNTVHAEDFENTEYIKSNPLFTECVGIPESIISEINKIIGRFFVAIQEASFVRQAVLDTVPTQWVSLRGETRHESSVSSHGSTLSANTLVSTVRQNITKAVRDVLSLLPEEKGVKLTMENSKSQRPYQKNETLTYAHRKHHENELGYAELLSDEAREMIDQFGEGCAELIHDILQGICEAILARAYLSYQSLARDMASIEMDRKRLSVDMETELPKEGIEGGYSTLNPDDFIERMQGILRPYPSALIFGLPDEMKERILSRIPPQEDGE